MLLNHSAQRVVGLADFCRFAPNRFRVDAPPLT